MVTHYEYYMNFDHSGCKPTSNEFTEQVRSRRDIGNGDDIEQHELQQWLDDDDDGR